MALVKTLATPVPTPVGSGVYAPHNVGPTDYAMCWEARTARPAATATALPSMVPGGPGLTGPTAALDVITPSPGSTYLRKTLNTQRLRVAGQSVRSRTILVVSSGWGNASSFVQIPGLVMGIANGNLNAFGTANVALGPDDASLRVRCIALDATAGQVWGQTGATVLPAKAITVGATTDVYLGSNANAPAGSEEHIVAARVWDRALSPAEIATVVEKAAAAYGVGL